MYLILYETFFNNMDGGTPNQRYECRLAFPGDPALQCVKGFVSEIDGV